MSESIWAIFGQTGHQHLVLPAQIMTDQSALCGYTPSHKWMSIREEWEKKLPHCKHCQKKEKK